MWKVYQKIMGDIGRQRIGKSDGAIIEKQRKRENRSN